MTVQQQRRNRSPRLAAWLALAGIGLIAGLFVTQPVVSQTTGVTPEIEIVEDDGGAFATLTEYIKNFQRRANAQIATHMKAIERGDDLRAFFLGLAIAFAYGIFHAFGPGHGKFIIVSYFLGREARVMRGVVMALQVAIVHVHRGHHHRLAGGHGPPGRLRDRAFRSAGCARRKLSHHRRHRPVHDVPSRANVEVCSRPAAGPVMDTATAMSIRTVTAAAATMTTITAIATAAGSKEACWPWRRAWCPVREPF